MSATDQPIAGPSSIPLYLINGVATIWDAQTAATLHCQYDISGLRVGTLPGVSQQNGFLGLPITLMQEETAYLVQQGIAHLVPVRSQPTLPSEEAVRAQRDARIKRIEIMERDNAVAVARAAEEGRRKYAEAGEKAKQKREQRARLKAAKKGGDTTGFDLGGETEHSTSASNISTVAKVTPSKAKPAQSPSIAGPTINNAGHFHTVQSHPTFPDLALAEPITSLPHALFPFPSTSHHRALVGTFTDLQSKEYRMGLGPRFGGEYLIYPGDYLRYHAHFTSQVIVNDEPIKPWELVAWGRLGTGTKKAGLLCCIQTGGEEEEKGGVEYYSLEWANFG